MKTKRSKWSTGKDNIYWENLNLILSYIAIMKFIFSVIFIFEIRAHWCKRRCTVTTHQVFLFCQVYFNCGNKVNRWWSCGKNNRKRLTVQFIFKKSRIFVHKGNFHRARNEEQSFYHKEKKLVLKSWKWQIIDFDANLTKNSQLLNPSNTFTCSSSIP